MTYSMAAGRSVTRYGRSSRSDPRRSSREAVMPLSRYFNKPGNAQPGKGAAIMAAMKQRYGPAKGERVFYGTVNKMRKGTPAQRAAQPHAPGSSLTAAAKRRRSRARQL